MIDNPKIRIALIHSNPLLLAGIKRILNDQAAFDVIVEANTIEPLLQNPDNDPDIILLNQELLENNVILETKKLSNIFPTAKLALFISDSENIDIEEAIHYHILGYFGKDTNIDLLVAALETINQNKYWLSPDMMQLVIAAYKQKTQSFNQQPRGPVTPPPKHLISRREYDVLLYLAKGYDNKDIGTALNIDESTVKNHFANMFKTNNVNGRTPLILKAIKNNWLQINGEEEDRDSEEVDRIDD